MDYAGKRTDVVDFGGDFDYGDMEWFRNDPGQPIFEQTLPHPQHAYAPPTPAPPPPSVPPQMPHDYRPSQQVVEQNEGFCFALSVAPNILWSRYKQYGQLGVLGWCAEFGELIDNLKELGFLGNMFVSTRTHALKACEEILQLKLEEVKMQIILMYLSSQVARLRRFLDGDKVWNDYPDLSFPLEPGTR